jgi:alanine racemase
MNELVSTAILRGRETLRPTHVEIDLARLGENYRAIKAAVAPAQVMPILKANAYGHGLVEIAKHLMSLDAPYLGVAFLEEGIALREAGVGTPILVMGGVFPNQVPFFLRYGLTLTASSVEKLCHISETAKKMAMSAKVHLKIDTGMERIGVHYFNADRMIDAAYSCSHCEIEGVYSHFATSDENDLKFAYEQLGRFEVVVNRIAQRNLHRPRYYHIANSGAILQMRESYFDMVRPGILFYGVYPSAQVKRTIQVHPSLSWKSRVSYFKVIGPDRPVSYGGAWRSDHMVRVLTIPIGYGDGYFRTMSGKAQIIVRGKRYPVVGNICMDQCMVNIEWDSAFNGDEVIILGEDRESSQRIACEELAGWANTNAYEILTNINARVPRVYLNAPA